jgi:hypothetical protein
MGQTGRALALAGVTMATMLGAMKISGVPFASADVQSQQRLDVDYNSLLGQLRWWCFHGHEWREISPAFEEAALLSCHQLLALADLQAKPLIGPVTGAPSTSPTPIASTTPAVTTPAATGNDAYACAAKYHKVGVGDCHGTIDTQSSHHLPTPNHTVPETYAECASLCDHHQKYYTIIEGQWQCVAYNFHTLTKECVLYRGTKPTSVASNEATTVCCASDEHG